MKKFLKIIAIIIFVLIAGVCLFLGYIIKFRPNVPVEDIKVELTPARLERGKYLAQNVAACVDCHSKRDWTKFAAPVVPGAEGQGGEAISIFYPPNITPFHLKDWSDGELLRAITSGVSKDGRPLMPIMPYPVYGKMDREDIYAIIAYIRSLPAVENTTPTTTPNFPMNIIVHTIPSSPEFSPRPATTDKINYGKYITTAASCVECHTQNKRGQIIEDLKFAGGRYIETPNGTVISPNLTPDKETGIGNWTEEIFIQRFKLFGEKNPLAKQTVAPGEFNTAMPWTDYSGMTREDLAAIFAYLQTVKPVSNRVPKNFIKN